jgi:histone H2B
MPSGKATSGKKGIRRRSTPNYTAYIHKILKQVHPDLQISSKTIMATNSLIEGVLENLTAKGGSIAKAAKKTTLSARHVQGATRMCLPIGLSKHAVSEGTKAVTKFSA